MPSARRVVAEVPFGLGRPSWAPDRAFDLEYHVRHTALPRGGGEAALARLVGHTHAIQLDRARPLWELWVIEGLAGDRVALYSKVHVAALDDTHRRRADDGAARHATRQGRPTVADPEPVAPTDGAGPLDVVGRIVGAAARPAALGRWLSRAAWPSGHCGRPASSGRGCARPRSR